MSRLSPRSVVQASVKLAQRLDGRLGHRAGRDRGAVSMIVGVLLAGGVLLGMTALVVDIGQLYAEREELQSLLTTGTRFGFWLSGALALGLLASSAWLLPFLKAEPRGW